MKINYSMLLKLAVTIAAIVAIAVVTIGVLAVPVVMSIMFSWYWLFLYIGYLLITFYVVFYLECKLGGKCK